MRYETKLIGLAIIPINVQPTPNRDAKNITSACEESYFLKMFFFSKFDVSASAVTPTNISKYPMIWAFPLPFTSPRLKNTIPTVKRTTAANSDAVNILRGGKILSIAIVGRDFADLKIILAGYDR